MEAITSALEEEKREAERLIQRYERELQELPQGSFFLRKIRSYYYGYITFSDNGKIGQKYLGRLNDEEAEKIKEQMVRRKKLLELKRKAERQKSFLEKALRHALKKS